MESLFPPVSDESYQEQYFSRQAAQLKHLSNYRQIHWKARRVGMAVDDGQVLRRNQNDPVDLVFDILLLRPQISEV